MTGTDVAVAGTIAVTGMVAVTAAAVAGSVTLAAGEVTCTGEALQADSRDRTAMKSMNLRYTAASPWAKSTLPGKIGSIYNETKLTPAGSRSGNSARV